MKEKLFAFYKMSNSKLSRVILKLLVIVFVLFVVFSAWNNAIYIINGVTAEKLFKENKISESAGKYYDSFKYYDSIFIRNYDAYKKVNALSVIEYDRSKKTDDFGNPTNDSPHKYYHSKKSILNRANEGDLWSILGLTTFILFITFLIIMILSILTKHTVKYFAKAVATEVKKNS